MSFFAIKPNITSRYLKGRERRKAKAMEAEGEMHALKGDKKLMIAEELG